MRHIKCLDLAAAVATYGGKTERTGIGRRVGGRADVSVQGSTDGNAGDITCLDRAGAIAGDFSDAEVTEVLQVSGEETSDSKAFDISG